MIRQQTAERIQTAIDRLVERGDLPVVLFPTVEVEPPKQAEHGDFATNWAMVAFKFVSGAPSSSDVCADEEGVGGGDWPKNPRNLAELLANELANDPAFTVVEVAGPGFVNVVLADRVCAGVLSDMLHRSAGSVLETPSHFARPSPSLQSSPPLRLNLEFVSVNPNGPITIGSGRGAAYGSTLANVLEAAGHSVHREYYINDGVNSEQMRLFAESVRAILLNRPVPANGYKGDYVEQAANEVNSHLHPLGIQKLIDGFASLAYTSKAPSEYQKAESQHVVKILEQIKTLMASKSGLALIEAIPTAGLQKLCEWVMTSYQGLDLETFGVTFDTWFSEQSLHDSGEVARCIEALEQSGVADDQPHRTKVKFAKGGVIEEVTKEEQAAEDEQAESPPPTPSSSAQASDEEGASETLWLRSTLFGDDMDRVLRRKDGRLTYIASDVAYHADKFKRGGKAPSSFAGDGSCPENEEGVGGGEVRADKLITILGPDHHGYIGRLHAVVAAELMSEGAPSSSDVCADEEGVGGGDNPLTAQESLLYGTIERRDACQAALALSREKLEVLIFQLVRFMKDGKPAPMRKRDGNIYALIDLVNEIGAKVKPEADKAEQQKAGKDVARFFYLMRHHDTTFDFDLNLAEKQSDENPVFYVQYAHARICGVLRKAEEAGISLPPTPSPVSSAQSSAKSREGTLHSREKALILKVADLPHEVARCAEDYAVSRLTTYAIELARAYHGFYDSCRVIDMEDVATSQFRLGLCRAAQSALRATLDLLGVSSPERM